MNVILTLLQRLVEALLYFANKSDQRKAKEEQVNVEKQEDAIDADPVGFFNSNFNGVQSDSTGDMSATSDNAPGEAATAKPKD